MRALATVAAALLGTACASRAPASRPAAVLYGDLERLVTVQAAAGWDIDRLEIDELMSQALMSACQTTTTAQLDLAAWLEAEVVRAGGPVDQAWRRAGKRSSKIGQLIVLDRVRQLLARALAAMPADCPYWAEASDDFRGRQITMDRWQLSLGGGGKGIVVQQGGRTDLNFGGAGRALIGRTFGTAHGVYTGLELGGSASFPRDRDTGERGALRLGFDVVAPVVYRRTFLNAYIEGEVGYLAHFTEDDPGDISHGIHVGAAIGGRATRQRLVFPGAALGISYERTFGDVGGLPPLTTFKLGLRVALDWDL